LTVPHSRVEHGAGPFISTATHAHPATSNDRFLALVALDDDGGTAESELAKPSSLRAAALPRRLEDSYRT
jgi:hypothetical protein